MNSDNNFQVYSALVDWSNSLKGLECWGMAAGAPAGSQFTLDFGNKIERPRVINNPMLNELQQQYRGEFRLFVEGASWRLETDTLVITSSEDDNSADGGLVKGLEMLIGLKVEICEVQLPAMDLTMKFAGTGLKLRIFCDQFSGACDNYNVFGPGVVIGIESRSQGTIEFD